MHLRFKSSNSLYEVSSDFRATPLNRSLINLSNTQSTPHEAIQILSRHYHWGLSIIRELRFDTRRVILLVPQRLVLGTNFLFHLKVN